MTTRVTVNGRAQQEGAFIRALNDFIAREWPRMQHHTTGEFLELTLQSGWRTFARLAVLDTGFQHSEAGSLIIELARLQSEADLRELFGEELARWSELDDPVWQQDWSGEYEVYEWPRLGERGHSRNWDNGKWGQGISEEDSFTRALLRHLSTQPEDA